MSWRKEETLLEEGFMAEARAETMQQERERGGARSLTECGPASMVW